MFADYDLVLNNLKNDTNTLSLEEIWWLKLMSIQQLMIQWLPCKLIWIKDSMVDFKTIYRWKKVFLIQDMVKRWSKKPNIKKGALYEFDAQFTNKNSKTIKRWSIFQ